MALIVALPIALPPVLPFTDLGGHVGRYAVQLDAGRDAQLAQWYTFKWLLLPNLGGDLLVQVLGPLVGLEPAVRSIVFAAAFLQALGILALSRAVHGRITPFAIFALPLVYSEWMLYGFLNYMLALGLLWCSLALWIVMSDRGSVRGRWVAFALIATVMWTCHLVGWALLCIGVGSQELVHQHERKGRLIPAALASIGPLTCMLAPWLIKLMIFQPATGTGDSTGWFFLAEKFLELFMVLRDKWFWLDIGSGAILVALIVWTWMSSACRLNRGLVLAGLITALCVVIVPERLLGSFYADQRLIEPALLFFLLAAGFSRAASRRLAQILLALAALFAGTRLAANTVSLWQLGNRSAEDLKVLDALPRHAQMVTLRAVACPPRGDWAVDRWVHISGYAVARRHAFSNDQWVLQGAQLLAVHNPVAGPFQVDDSQINFEGPCEGRSGVVATVRQIPAAIPYLWVIWSTHDLPLAGWLPVARHGRSILYHRAG